MADQQQAGKELCDKRANSDCYYCVSGCPETRADHAQCCVEMGLSMIQAIREFDEERSEGVNMRVGIHTGTILCGIVGTKRFKFDVWSNDVTLANKMESTGRPGMVHVSDKTVSFLQDQYFLEDGLQTYFILGSKDDKTPTYSGSFRAEGRQKYSNSLQLFVSPPCTTVTAASPVRPRVLSCDTSSNYIKPTQLQSQHLLSPDVCKMKASSLPSILDMESDESVCISGKNNDISYADDVKTPTSTASSGKYTVKLKNWKIPKFMRKLSDQRQDAEVDVFVVSPLTPMEDGYQQVPTIIEANVNGNKKDTTISITKNDREDSPKENIDIKSYISQSRSDIGQFDYSSNSDFMRSGSYRSQYGRSPLGEFSYLHRAGSSRSRRGRSPVLEGLEPRERARSATVTTVNMHRPKRSFDLPSRLSSVACLEENVNQSRKDSGIRSNSRRSSIQIDNTMNSEILHRVSGYYTSSQCSINIPQVPRNYGPFFDKYGTSIQNLRKQSDRQLIKCVQDNSKSRSSYFIKPPLSKVALFFKDLDMERQYRENVHHIAKRDERAISTLAHSNFNTYLDVIVSIMVFLLVSFGAALLYGVTNVWLITFFTLLLSQCLGLALCLKPIVRWFDRVFWCFIRFYRWNIFGVILDSCNIEEMQTDNPVSNVSVVFDNYVTEISGTSSPCHFFKAEMVLNLLILVILIWVLTRDFETRYRLSFHANFVANRDKNKVQKLKNQADYLIYNIVPEHVAEQLKKDAKYSENFKNVAIIFASIVNFNEMYDESYEGGREYLRVLNELIGDFDELLDREEFHSVEKIKTIGSTFMAASGLNSHKRQRQKDPNEHLYALMDFALEMQNVVNAFNRDLLGFDLELRVGYNFGDVTAAVIGNTKLYYDIWGDAVNIASRMDSTGKKGRIQVGENCLEILQEKYEFEPRGSVYVKGKDNMNVYFVKKKKTSPFLSVPDP
ncbi:hypothetical protein JTB14_000119 [Gonioctena quinquepunctata]|nr:hypothetical protein JTB14_000119 [Gonioctena quinquepunctata]